ncbi:coiled-coil domain-containing protein [Clarias magur]|uniref:Coiled-coil domain-containing protein n=1 Tax=Clarias magur TaxID=1594786 RepID=A0A8J4TMU6_CLAMG|nr:coiled-coil domain-containing protein [Clarias magur]
MALAKRSHEPFHCKAKGAAKKGRSHEPLHCKAKVSSLPAGSCHVFRRAVCCVPAVFQSQTPRVSFLPGLSETVATQHFTKQHLQTEQLCSPRCSSL